ncbi:ubiquinol-cytochrome C reductase [Candidatus Pelagibacter sp.]|nr:ubiquinol-cytochrome C reductase [Candidatus Pelagibacter sp.]
MTNKSYINIYNNLIKYSRNKSIFTFFTEKDTFSDRLLIFLFHFAFFLREYKKTEKKELLQDVFDYIFRELEISIREIGYGDASINKRMKTYVNSLYSILEKIEYWEKLKLSEKNEIFKSFFNYDGDVSNLIEYFDKYGLFLKKKSFNLFLNGVINLEI